MHTPPAILEKRGELDIGVSSGSSVKSMGAGHISYALLKNLMLYSAGHYSPGDERLYFEVGVGPMVRLNKYYAGAEIGFGSGKVRNANDYIGWTYLLQAADADYKKFYGKLVLAKIKNENSTFGFSYRLSYLDFYFYKVNSGASPFLVNSTQVYTSNEIFVFLKKRIYKGLSYNLNFGGVILPQKYGTGNVTHEYYAVRVGLSYKFSHTKKNFEEELDKF